MNRSGWPLVPLSVLLIGCAGDLLRDVPEGHIITVAGGYTGDNGPATDAGLNRPADVIFDRSGNILIADQGAHRIRRIEATTGVITTIAGTGSRGYAGDGGAATAAQLNFPNNLALDSAGNLYIAFGAGLRIRKIDAATGIITTVAGANSSGFGGDGGPATTARLDAASHIALDRNDNLFIADSANHRIRRVDATTGIITTIAGTGYPASAGDGGPALAAQFRWPQGLVFDRSGNLYVSDSSGVRRIDIRGNVTSFASMSLPTGLSIESGGLLVFEAGAHRVRRVDLTTGAVTTVAGNGSCGFSGDGGPATMAALALGVCSYGGATYYSGGKAIRDTQGRLIVTDVGNDRIRRVDNPSGVISTIAGIGVGDGRLATRVVLHEPAAMAVDARGNLFFGEIGRNLVRRVNSVTGVITTVAGGGQSYPAIDGLPATSAALVWPGVHGLAIDAAGDLYVGEGTRVVRIAAATGIISTIAGSANTYCSSLTPMASCGDGGPALAAALSGPDNIAIDAAGNLAMAEWWINRIRRVDRATGVITTIAGTGEQGWAGDNGLATGVKLSHPRGITADGSGNLFFADFVFVRRLDVATGMISTIAGVAPSGFAGDGGAAGAAQFGGPHTIARGRTGFVFIGDPGNSRVRRIYEATGIIDTYAGNGVPDQTGDGGPATQAAISWGSRIALDAADNVFIAGPDRIRAVRTARDTTPPTISVPANVTVSATSPSGVLVTYPAPTASDVSPIASLGCLPNSGTIFAIGTATVTCTAIDAPGNTSTATFTVTVLGPADQAANLISTLQGMQLPSGIETSLVSKLQQVESTLRSGGSVTTACNQLDAFIAEVQSQTGSTITVAEANQLLAEAARIKQVLACP